MNQQMPSCAVSGRTLIQMQDEYIETVLAGEARWAHRLDGGHARRIRRGALRRLYRQLRKYPFAQAEQIVRDADDMAKLKRACDQ